MGNTIGQASQIASLILVHADRVPALVPRGCLFKSPMSFLRGCCHIMLIICRDAGVNSLSQVVTSTQANAVSDKILDLRMCDYTGKNLSGKVLSGALLKDATLPNSILRETVLTKVRQSSNHDTGCMSSTRLAGRPCCLSAVAGGMCSSLTTQGST